MPTALLDSNVVVAIVVEDHAGHVASLALLAVGKPATYGVAAHSFAEAYNTLTRRNPGAMYRWNAAEAWAAVESVAARTTLVGLTPSQTLEAIGAYAADGGIGPRLYDRLIGQVALQYAIPRLITWNGGHMRGLFPQLEVIDPASAI